MPDGERFVAIAVGDGVGSAGAEQSSIIVVEHWFEELKGLVPVD